MPFKIAFCSNQCNPYYNEVGRGVADSLHGAGDAELLSLNGMHRFPVQALRMLDPDAIIAGPVHPKEVAAYFPDVPVVGISNALHTKPFPSVLNDDLEAGRQAARAAVHAGYEHVLTLNTLDFHFTALREHGAREACRDWNVSYESFNMEVRKTRAMEKFQDVWDEFQQNLKSKMLALPANTALIAMETRLAGDILSLQSEVKRLKIPEDFGLILADLPQDDTPGIAHVRLRGHAIGAMAVKLLLEKCRNPAFEIPQETRIEPDGAISGDTLRLAPSLFNA